MWIVSGLAGLSATRFRSSAGRDMAPLASTPQKLMPKEAQARGIDLVTPNELLTRHKFNERRAIRRFLSDWNANVDEYLVGSPDARETLGYARSFFQRLAKNDWTP